MTDSYIYQQPLPPLLMAAKAELERLGYRVVPASATTATVVSWPVVRVTEPHSDAPPPRRGLHAPDEDAPPTAMEGN